MSGAWSKPPGSDTAITAIELARALRHEVGALERIDGDVDLAALAVADTLADVEHRGLVPLTFADHDPSR